MAGSVRRASSLTSKVRKPSPLPLSTIYLCPPTCVPCPPLVSDCPPVTAKFRGGGWREVVNVLNDDNGVNEEQPLLDENPTDNGIDKGKHQVLEPSITQSQAQPINDGGSSSLIVSSRPKGKKSHNILVYCLSRVPPSSIPNLSLVCRRWIHLLLSPIFSDLRRNHDLLRQTLFALSAADSALFAATLHFHPDQTDNNNSESPRKAFRLSFIIIIFFFFLLAFSAKYIERKKKRRKVAESLFDFLFVLDCLYKAGRRRMRFRLLILVSLNIIKYD
ncbi:hypothetical protein F8388_005522 [Cannabis sativa]|uniref:F-box domain-containing protein n=1 Tax=Cannabis sativa TaxID=3483 RepID=A0A7J6GYH7_CANSA|nr:hypothetical protein F8388_005522 [Cannabis sativa]